MAARFSLALGPVFDREFRAVPRRWQVFAGRTLFVGMLLIGLWAIWAPAGLVFHKGNFELLSLTGRRFSYILVGVQLAVVALVAPAATAGSICVDKSRGTLHHVFVTDLSDREIILGKLAARVLSVFALMMCGLPVLAITGLLGGVDYSWVAHAYAVTAAVAVVACSVAMAVSLRVKKPQQALLATYVVLGLWLALHPIYRMIRFRIDGVSFTDDSDRVIWWVYLTNPAGQLGAPIVYPTGHGTRHLAAFVSLALAASALLTIRSIRDLRRVVIGQADRPMKRQRADMPFRLIDLIPGPPLDGNPILWREWHRKRPTRWIGRAWIAFAGLSTLASGFAIFSYFTNPGGIGPDQLAANVNAANVTLGLLLLTISATASLAEERDRGSLDVILATPMSTATILWGKWLGTFAMVPRLAILPVWVTIALAIISGQWVEPFALIGLILAYSAFATGLGVALATWIPNLGRAIGTGVFLYMMVPVSLTFLASSQTTGYFLTTIGWNADIILLGIPFVGVYEATISATGLPFDPIWALRRRFMTHPDPSLALTLGPMLAYFAAAGWLLSAAIASFDRLLDRMTTDLRLDKPPLRDPSLAPSA